MRGGGRRRGLAAMYVQYGKVDNELMKLNKISPVQRMNMEVYDLDDLSFSL